MADLGKLLLPGKKVVAQTSQGPVYRGVVRKSLRGWIAIDAEGGRTLLNLDHLVSVVVLGADDDEDMEAAGGLMKPQSLERPRVLTRTAPARAWQDEDLKKLATGFLDGDDDATLSEAHHRARSQIRELRQAFECARGNLVEDQISPVAQTWITRWRRVLTPA